MTLGVAWLACVAVAAADAPPSLAVFPLRTEGGVTEGAARLVTETMVDDIRASGAFSRVVTVQEIEAAVGLERQKQLVDCTLASCLAELSGALGVDYVLVGSAGRLGSAYVLSARIVRARDAFNIASASVTRPASDDALLLSAAKQLVQRLLEAPLLRGDRPVSSPESGGGMPLAAGGGALLGAGALGVAPVTIAAVLAVSALVAPMLVHVPTPGVSGDGRLLLFPAVSGAGLVIALVVALLASAVAAVGVGLMVMGVRKGVP